MVSVQSGNKESPSCDDKVGEKALDEDFNKLKLKEISMAKELGGKMKQDKEAKKEQEQKMEAVAKKEVELGPEEFLKHPLQVIFFRTMHILWFIQKLFGKNIIKYDSFALCRMPGRCGSSRTTRRAPGKRTRGPFSPWPRLDH